MDVIPVSIPIGFSNELQPFSDLRRAPTAVVSIPIGFSNELQQPPFSGLIGIVPAFLPQIGAMCSWAPSVPDLYKYP